MASRRKKGVHRLPKRVVRQQQRWDCRLHHKSTYNYRTAVRVAHRLDDAQRPYWCPVAGGYHVTRLEPGEFDRRQQEFLPATRDQEGSMRVLVAGSRMWDDAATVWAALDAVAAEAVAAGATELVVVHGDHHPPMKNGRYELRSADNLADMWARRSGHPLPVRTEPHPAKWDRCASDCKPGHRKIRQDGRTWCPTAGLRRNADMVDMGADWVLCFMRNRSHDLRQFVDLATRAGLTVRQFEVSDDTT